MAVALLALALGACAIPTEFATPIEEPGTRKVDLRLLGTWYGVSGCRFNTGSYVCQEDGNRPALLTVLHIGLEGDATALTIRQTAIALDLADLEPGLRARGQGRVVQFEAVAWPALLDGVPYYSLRRRAGFGYDYTPAGEKPGYIVAQFEVDAQDLLHYRFLSESTLRNDAELKALGMRLAGAEVQPVVGYLIADFTRERLLDYLRGQHHPRIDGGTFGPFRRPSRAFDLARPDAVACAPDRDRRMVRLRALADVALDLAKYGPRSEARESAALALAAERAGVRDTPKGYLARIAEAQGRLHDLAAAGRTAARIGDYIASLPKATSEDDLQRWSGTIAEATAWAGESRVAIQLAEGLPTATFASIAQAQANLGDWTGAMESARRSEQAHAFLAVEEEFSRKGARAEARATLLQARAWAGATVSDLVSIGERQLRRGLREDGRRTASAAAALLPEHPEKTEISTSIALAKLQVDLEEPEGARKTLASISALPEQRNASAPIFRLGGAKLIALLSHLGDRTTAREMQKLELASLRERRTRLQLDGGSTRREVQELGQRMAETYAAIGDTAEAIELAQSLDAVARVRALYGLVAIQQFVPRDPSAMRATLRLAHESARALQASDPDAVASNHYYVAAWAGLHKQAGESNRARLLYTDATRGVATAPLRRYQHPEGIKQRVSDLLFLADHQQSDGFADDARLTRLKAFEMARAMPELSPCDSDELLRVLGLPELGRKAD